MCRTNLIQTGKTVLMYACVNPKADAADVVNALLVAAGGIDKNAKDEVGG